MSFFLVARLPLLVIVGNAARQQLQFSHQFDFSIDKDLSDQLFPGQERGVFPHRWSGGPPTR